MSFADGMAAIHLQMPARVPRTEYSAESYHFDLIAAVTGRRVTTESPDRWQAAQAFERAWDYSFRWSTLIGGSEFGDLHTRMGHAAYAEGGGDLDRRITQPFRDTAQVLAFDPWQALGMIDKPALVRRFDAHYQANCAANPDAVNPWRVASASIACQIHSWVNPGVLKGIGPFRSNEHDTLVLPMMTHRVLRICKYRASRTNRRWEMK